MVDKQWIRQTERKKKNSRFRNNRISVLVVQVLLLQHPVLVLFYLSSSSVVVLPDCWVRRRVLWTAMCPISGSGSLPIHFQPICLSRLCLLKVHMNFSSLLLPSSLVHWLVGCLLFQALFTESSHRDQLLAPLPFSGALSDPAPSAVCPFSSLFIIQIFFVGQGSVCPGGYAGLSQG
jgi:hypothetical protein